MHQQHHVDQSSSSASSAISYSSRTIITDNNHSRHTNSYLTRKKKAKINDKSTPQDPGSPKFSLISSPSSLIKKKKSIFFLAIIALCLILSLIGSFFYQHHIILEGFASQQKTSSLRRRKISPSFNTNNCKNLSGKWFTIPMIEALRCLSQEEEDPPPQRMFSSGIFHCVLAMMHNNRNDNSNEKAVPYHHHHQSFADVFNDVEDGNGERILPARCLNSEQFSKFREFYQINKVHSKNMMIISNKKESRSFSHLKLGMIPKSTIFSRNTRQSQLLFDPTPFAKPLHCKRGNYSLHPIGFGIPSSVIISQSSIVRQEDKIFDFMPLLPRNLDLMKERKENIESCSSSVASSSYYYSFSFADEAVYREMISLSKFSFVSSRHGWDSLRLYEILASGSIPFFVDLEDCPEHSLTHLPKKELLSIVKNIDEVRHVYENSNEEFYEKRRADDKNNRIRFKKPGTINMKSDTRNAAATFFSKLDVISTGLLEYTRRFLSCGSVSQYLLNTLLKKSSESSSSSLSTIKNHTTKILLINRGDFNYMDRTIFVGLTELGYDLGEDLFVASPSVDSNSVKQLLQFDEDESDRKFHSESDRGRKLEDVSKNLWGNGMSFVARGRRRRSNGTRKNKNITQNKGLLLHDEIESFLLSGKIQNDDEELLLTIIFTFIPHNDDIYPKQHPLVQRVLSSSPRTRVAFVDGDDIDAHQMRYWNSHFYEGLSKIGTVFAREIGRPKEDLFGCV